MEFKPLERLKQENGFVLVTAIVLMALLLMMGIGISARSLLNQQASLTEKQNTQAYYYAETAINYIIAAYGADSELDGYDPADPPLISYADFGDQIELAGNFYAPGPTAIDAADGQLSYFDNRPLGDRAYSFDGTDPGASQDLTAISNQLFPHLVVNIDRATGAVSLGTQPPDPPDQAVTQAAIPTNGAIVWMTAADPATKSDMEVVAPPYDIVAYALVYIDTNADGVGEPSRLVRVIWGNAPAP